MPETRIGILLATVSHRPSATDSEPLIPERLVPGTTGCTLLVALLVLTAFSGALTQAEFLSDDWVFLYESQSWTQIFSVGIGYHYVPVFLLYLKLLQAGVGLDAAWFGAGNLLLHATNAVLLGTIARTFTRDAALGLTVSLVYCTHALVNEGVFWVTGSATLLMVAFFLATLRSYLWATETDVFRARLLVPYGFGFLCLYTLESGATAFAVCAFVDGLQQFERNHRRIDGALAKRFLGVAARVAPFAFMVLSILVIKQMSGGEVAVARDFVLSRTYAMVVQYFVHLWVPFGPALGWLFDFDSKRPFWHWVLTDHLGALHTSAVVFGVVPSALILWKGSRVQVFAWAWFVTVTVALSLATLGVASRYQVMVGAPGTLLLAVTLWRGIGTAGRMLPSGSRRWRIAVVFAVFGPIVGGGIATNIEKGHEYQSASELTHRLLQSKTLERALRQRGERKLVVLNLPDHAEVTTPSVPGLAYIFRNGFTHALALRGHIVHPDAVAVARQQGFGYAQNVWQMANQLSPELIEEKIRDGTVSFIRYGPKKRDFRRLGPAKADKSVSLSELGS